MKKTTIRLTLKLRMSLPEGSIFAETANRLLITVLLACVVCGLLFLTANYGAGP